MLRLARVAAVHHDDHSVDLVMVDDGSRHAGAQVMSWSASSNSGTHDLPTPSTPASGDKWALSENTDCDMIAVTAMIGRRPLVLGFLYPQISQMLFTDKNRRVSRHSSDVYSTIDGDGNMEVYHPSGAYFRIATDTAHEDLSGADVDGKWKIAKNTAAQVHIHVEQAGGKAKVDIAPNGDINAETVTQATLKAAVKVTLDTPETTITGHCTIQGGMAVSGGTGGTATITGNVAIIGTTLTHNGTNVGSTHVHPDPQGGNTSPPA